MKAKKIINRITDMLEMSEDLNKHVELSVTRIEEAKLLRDLDFSNLEQPVRISNSYGHSVSVEPRLTRLNSMLHLFD